MAKEERAVTSREFSAYILPLDMVNSFQFLGRVILAADENWPAVVRNFSRARVVWKIMTRILSREGAEPRVSVFFFNFRGTDGSALWRRDLGGHPLHGKIPGGVPGSGGAASDREDPDEENLQEVRVHLGGDGKGGDRLLENG